jgi:hypothetical protein
MFRSSSKALATGLVFVTLASGVAYAATQGILGGTSQGTAVINAAKGNSVRISGLADLTFPASVVTPAPLSQTACIYSTSGSYTIQTTSSYTLSGVYRMRDSSTAYINYSVGWYNTPTGGTATTLLSGTPSGTIANANTASTTCAGASNARFEVTIDNTSFTAAPSGPYSDTLTLLVAPI